MIVLVLLAIIKEVVSQTSYEYRQVEKFTLVPWAFQSDDLKDFYLPNQETYLLRFGKIVRMVNKHLPDFEAENINRTSADFYFGRQVSLVNFYDDNVTKVVKSYQYPDKIVESYFNQPAFNSIMWVNSTTAVAAAQFNKKFYIGFYKSNTDLIDLRQLPSLTQRSFKGTVALSENDILLVCDDYLYVLDLINMSNIYSLPFKGQAIQQNCINTFSAKTSETILVQYIMVKVGVNIKKYIRRIAYNQDGSISFKSKFELQVEFLDLSFSCAFNFLDANHILIMNASSSVIIRSAILQDFFIGKRQTKLLLNSIGVKGSSDLFIYNGNLQKLNYSDLSISIVYKNLTNTSNQKKAWTTKKNETIVFAGSTVAFTYSIEGKPYIANVVDCQLIEQNILFYISTDSPTKLIAYDVSNNTKITAATLNISSDNQIQMQLVNQPGKNYCLLEIYQKGSMILHQVWSFNPQTNALEKQVSYNHTVNKHKRTIIPSQLTFEIEEEITDDSTILHFWTLGNTDVYDLVVPRYKWLKVTDKAFAIYINDDSKECRIYRFVIDADKKSITVNGQKPVIIRLDQMSSAVQQNQIFLLEDLRSNAQPNNFLIYFYDESNSYYYNTLDPILKTTRLNYFSFSSQQASNLLIKPHIIQNRVYFALSNSSLVAVYAYLQQQISEFSNNFSKLFYKCSSISMKLLKQKSGNLIGFTCPTQQKDILIIYKQSTIIRNDIKETQKLLVSDKLMKSYSISENGELAMINVRQGDDYLDFYRSSEDVTIPVTQNFMCLSQNGYYLVYNNSGIFLMDVMTTKSVKIQESFTTNYACTVDDSGDWIVFYRANSNQILRIYYRFTFFKEIVLKVQIVFAQFVQERLLIRTVNDLYYYDDLQKGNITYLVKDNTKSPFRVDANQRFIAYSVQNDGYYVYVCELGVCYSRFRHQSYYYTRKVHADGRVVSWYSSSGLFLASAKQIRSCGQGKYISNGECKDCAEDCEKCEAQTGACLDCMYGYGFYVATICLGIIPPFFLIVAIIFFCCRIRKIKNRQASSLLRSSMLDQLEEKRKSLIKKCQKLEAQLKQKQKVGSTSQLREQKAPKSWTQSQSEQIEINK